MQSVLLQHGRRFACSAHVLAQFLAPNIRPAQQGFRAASVGSAAAASSSALAPDTDVAAAVLAAAAAAGRSIGPAEQQLAERLQDNMYTTAAAVAAMSPEELAVLNVPIKLWATLKAQLQAHQQQERQQSPGSSAPDASAAGGGSGQAAPGPAGAQQFEPLPADIMQRRMPRARRLVVAAAGEGAAAGSTHTQQQQQQQQQPLTRATVYSRSKPLTSTGRYGLRECDIGPALAAELAALERFCTGRWFGQLADPILPVTYTSVTRHYVKLLLGYLHNVKGVPLEQLRLASLVPSPGREGVSLLLEYQAWRKAQRGTAPSTATVPIKALTHVARFLYHDLAKPPTQTGQRPYHDLEVVAELTGLQRTATKAALGAERVAEEGRKWLEWGDYLRLVAALRAECAGLTASGQPRSRKAVAVSLQRYLIAAILSVVPDRQRTLRELEVGRTLLRRPDGVWVIKHSAGDYKTGKQYGDRPPLVLAPFLYPELEAFIDTWRAELQPQTRRLFCRAQTGGELTAHDCYTALRSSALRLTGKATNPHLVRDMIVTHAKLQKKSESQMEALALFMGHSVKMQRSSYDRRSKAQKVTPAVELLQGLWQQDPRAHHQ